MPKIELELGPFTPIPDILAKDPDFGLNGAAVYGIVWRYCQRYEGICTAAATTLGDQLGISEKTVRRNLNRLAKEGFLENLALGIQGKSKFKVTNKLRFEGRIDVVVSETDRESELAERTESPFRTDRESVQNPKNGQRVRSERTESPIKRGDSFKETKESAGGAPIHSKSGKQLKGKHPAVEIYKQIVTFYPTKGQIPLIEETVTDLTLWRGVVREWIACGWSPRNIQGMLEYYNRREIPSTRQEWNQNGKKSKRQNPAGPGRLECDKPAGISL